MDREIIDKRELVTSRIKLLIDFLGPYIWIANSYVTDYFVNGYKEKVPAQWLNLLVHLEPKELASLLSLTTWNSRHVWPLSLLAFRTTANTLCLDRFFKIFSEASTNLNLKSLASNIFSLSTEQFQNGQYPPLEHCYRKHVKPKKQHEILQLAKVIDKVAQLSDCRRVVDVGAGQGHLSRLLSFGLGLHVTTVEADGCHVPKAEKFDGEVEMDIVKGKMYTRKQSKLTNREKEVAQNMQSSLTSPKHVVAKVQPSASVEDFLRTLQLVECDDKLQDKSNKPICNILNEHPPGNEDFSHVCITSKKCVNDVIQNIETINEIKTDTYTYTQDVIELCHTSDPNDYIKCDKSNIIPQQFLTQKNGRCKHYAYDGKLQDSSPAIVMTGLHACGDLTPTMLRVFKKCPNVVGLASIGCCYMKMDMDATNSNPGYPMSVSIKELGDFPLSYEACEMACHFCDAYHDRLLEGSSILRTHAARAALQSLIISRDPTMSHENIKLNIKRAHLMPVQRYAQLALQKLGLNVALSANEEKTLVEQASYWQEVVAFYTLRLALAPAIESLILLDRVLFLLEAGIPCTVLPIFNPRVSPRNFAVVALKNVD